MDERVLSHAEIERFDADGYLIVKDLFDADFVSRTLDLARRDQDLATRAKHNSNYESEGLDTRLVYREDLDDNIYTAYVQSRRIVGPLQQLMGDRMRHYYHLAMLKDPGTGGWQWHQDYGYHYKEFLWPDFISVMVALEAATPANGCLRVLKGSNRLGRLEHQQSGAQLIADPDRVERAKRHCEEIHCELKPGSVLYFHGNVLHASDANQGPGSRWSFVQAYVAAANECVLPEVEAKLSPSLEAWDDEHIEEVLQRHEERVS
jgi:ectoine hydroxylase-related dioxygenase (phytanoyl-CoA dioxygenase family)